MASRTKEGQETVLGVKEQTLWFWNEDSPEHDGFDPLSALSVGQPHAKSPRVASQEWLSKLVAIV